MIHSFLIIGQSNMAGRGFINEVEPIENPNLKVLRNGRWQNMFVPVNPDRKFSGINLAESFIDAYSKDHDVEVGIIPCADGGTSLEQWQPGGLLFDNAVNCARLAMRTSHLAGVLWHQGEGDCSADRYPFYCERFQKIMDALRAELNIPDIPFLVGGLGDFLAECTLSENCVNYPYVNEALQKIARENKNCAFVSAEGLGANPDNLHFNAASLTEFGVRYFNVYQKLGYNVITDGELKENDNNRTAMEAL